MSTVALERQIRPIYGRSPYCLDLPNSKNLTTDALDTGSNKSALVSCNKLLKKYPQNELIKVLLPHCDLQVVRHSPRIPQALKALALVRSQKVEESLVLCDEVLEAKPTNDAILTAMMHVLRGLGRRTH